MLHSLASRLNQLNDVAQIGEAITAELRTVVDDHNSRVHLLSEDGTTLVPIAFRGKLSEYQGEPIQGTGAGPGTRHRGHHLPGRGNGSRFQALEESAVRLRTLDEMKNMFFHVVSHELRDPPGGGAGGSPSPWSEMTWSCRQRRPGTSWRGSRQMLASSIGSPRIFSIWIGLFLVAKFAELHGGRAWVEDRAGGGSSFRFFLRSAA